MKALKAENHKPASLSEREELLQELFTFSNILSYTCLNLLVTIQFPKGCFVLTTCPVEELVYLEWFPYDSLESVYFPESINSLQSLSFFLRTHKELKKD